MSAKVSMANDPYLTPTRLAELFGVTTRTIYNWRKAGWLPPPVRLPNGRKAWRESAARAAVESVQAAA
jgi:predicted DNA-binding transcriptional regulator AlpA